MTRQGKGDEEDMRGREGEEDESGTSDVCRFEYSDSHVHRGYDCTQVCQGNKHVRDPRV